MSEIILQGITEEHLLIRIREIVKEEIGGKLNQSLTNPEEYITRKEAALLLKITLPTLHDWTKMGLLKAYKLRNRVWYMRKELDLQIASNSLYKHKRLSP